MCNTEVILYVFIICCMYVACTADCIVQVTVYFPRLFDPFDVGQMVLTAND